MTQHSQELSEAVGGSTTPSLGSHIPKPRSRRWLLIGGGALLAAAFAWSALGRSATGSEALASDAPARDVPYLDGQNIRYSAAFAARNKLAFAHVANGSLSPIMYITGTVEYAPDRVVALGARIPGRVRNVFKLEGDQVKVGDVLAEIESAELGAAQAAIISARARYAAAHANGRREKELAAAKISSSREAEVAAALEASAQADLQAAEGRVRAMGGELNGEPGILQLRSPLEGRVVARHLLRGQFVEPTLTAFKIADLSRVFVELAVFERDVATIHTGDKVEFTVPGIGHTQVPGRVSYVGDEIDLQTKTAAVRVIVEDAPVPLRPGQSVMATIHTSARVAPTLVLPREAVTSVDGKWTVFVAHGDNSVEPRSIELGRQDGSQVEIIKGLKEGERVASNGVFALKSEIFR
ncbi:MAG TPA: efflux RND transporter periplasmic adaptor subunit [Polyangiales bacterium]|nr:efflux RND transporter periplasmic adaptor subunit [Polyangiales bacterium]